MAGKKKEASSAREDKFVWHAGDVVWYDRNGKPFDINKLNEPEKKPAAKKPGKKK